MPVIKISPEMCFHACVEILWFSKIHYVCGFLFVCFVCCFSDTCFCHKICKPSSEFQT